MWRALNCKEGNWWSRQSRKNMRTLGHVKGTHCLISRQPRDQRLKEMAAVISEMLVVTSLISVVFTYCLCLEQCMQPSYLPDLTSPRNNISCGKSFLNCWLPSHLLFPTVVLLWKEPTSWYQAVHHSPPSTDPGYNHPEGRDWVFSTIVSPVLCSGLALGNNNSNNHNNYI